MSLIMLAVRICSKMLHTVRGQTDGCVLAYISSLLPLSFFRTDMHLQSSISVASSQMWQFCLRCSFSTARQKLLSPQVKCIKLLKFCFPLDNFHFCAVFTSYPTTATVLYISIESRGTGITLAVSPHLDDLRACPIWVWLSTILNLYTKRCQYS